MFVCMYIMQLCVYVCTWGIALLYICIISLHVLILTQNMALCSLRLSVASYWIGTVKAPKGG